MDDYMKIANAVLDADPNKRRRRRCRRALEAARDRDWSRAIKLASRAAHTSEMYKPLVKALRDHRRQLYAQISAENAEGQWRQDYAENADGQ